MDMESVGGRMQGARIGTSCYIHLIGKGQLHKTNPAIRPVKPAGWSEWYLRPCTGKDSFTI